MGTRKRVKGTSGGDGVAPSAAPSGVELNRELARRIIANIAGPLIGSGLLELDEVLSLIRMGAASSLQSTGKSQRVLAAHLNKSRRWFQSTLAQARSAGLAGPEPAGDEALAAKGPSSTSYRIMLKALEVLVSRHPQAVSLAELTQVGREAAWHLTDRDIVERLELYQEFGLLEKVLGEEGAHYRATSLVLARLPNADRMEKVEDRVKWLFPLAMAYCEGRGEFGGAVAELSPEALVKVRERLKESFAEIIAEAVAETQRSDGKNVHVSAILAMGETGGFDDTAWWLGNY